MRGPSETPARIAGDPAAEQLRLLIDGIAEYAVVTMDADGRIRTWNAGAELLTGHEAGAIEGRSASILYSPADRSAGRPDQDLAVAAAAGRFHQEAWRVRRDGRGFWADVLISPLRGADDRL